MRQVVAAGIVLVATKTLQPAGQLVAGDDQAALRLAASMPMKGGFDRGIGTDDAADQVDVVLLVVDTERVRSRE